MLTVPSLHNGSCRRLHSSDQLWLIYHSAFGGMVAFCVIVGDTIPHVFTAVFPKLHETSVLWLLSDRRFVIVLFILGISYPLSLYRDIAKVSIDQSRVEVICEDCLSDILRKTLSRDHG